MSSTTNGAAGPRRARAGPGNGPELLADKLRIPQLSLAILRRRRLIDLIDQAAGHRLTVVSGPAGAGKTVACGSWASSAGRRVAWLTLDAGDREPARFWEYVQTALARAAGPPSTAVAALRQTPANPAEPSADFALRLTEAAQSLTEPVTLVLDDVHELAGGPVVAGLELLIRHAPPTLRLILSGRCPPPLQLARLRLSGDLADVTAADLACTAEEADAYFAMLGLEADAETRDELLQRTEGWMAGLRLAAMSAAGPDGNGHDGARGRVASISGDEPLVSDYLRDEVLARQPAETRLFMLRTSVTEQTSGDLADALTGEPGGARMLERLSRQNNFVEVAAPCAGNNRAGPHSAAQHSAGQLSAAQHSVSDHGGAAYRYHTLLREVLATELARQMPHEVPILLRRAARWHAAHDQAIDALRYAAQAADWDYAAHMLAEAGTAALVRSGAATLEDVLARFPADSRADDAAVAAALAAARLWHGDPDGAAHHLDGAERALGRCAPAERRVIEPWLAALRVMQAASRSAADPGLLARSWTLADHGQAAAGTQPEHRALGLLWFALGTARLRRWEIGAARYALNHACLQLTAGGLAELCSRARGWQALAEAWYGDLTAAEKALGELRQSGFGPGGPPPGAPRDGEAVSSCLAAVTSALLSLDRDDLTGARKLLDDCGDQEAGRHRLPGEPDLAAVAGLIRARAALAGEDATGARAIVLRLRDTSAPGDPPLERLLTLLDCEIAVRTGEAGRARITLLQPPDGATADRAEADRATADRATADRAEADRAEADVAEADRADGRLMLGRLLLSEGDFTGAAEAVTPVIDGTATEVTMRLKVAALVVAAVASRRGGHSAAAAELLQQALALAEPDGACRVFLDAGQPARSAITVLVPPASRGASFASRILERFDTQLPHGGEAPESPAVLLTSSELAVLRFLPSHLTNQEIAEALFLSINTVKTHLRAAYRKLGVASRRAAIARARRLGLI
jgi:LuxR family transcriptional regulator, maltose regulon positive regulatory protein